MSDNRSIQAHNTEWWYYGIIAEETGMTPYRVYETLVRMFLKTVDAQGKTRYLKPSCLTVRQHHVYLQHVITEAAEMGIELPEPEQMPAREPVYKTMRLDG